MTTSGSYEAVEALAYQLNAAGQHIDELRLVGRSSRPEEWQGRAADAYAAALNSSLDGSLELAETLHSAAAVLQRYATAQRAESLQIQSAQQELEDAARSLELNPADGPAIADILESQLSARIAYGRLQLAARVAARDLARLQGSEGADRPWWDPFGWFREMAEPDERVTADILSQESFDPDDVSQGSLGDCYVLSTVVSLLNTNEGDKYVREHIRWDPQKNGYWVIIYKSGTPREVFVEHVFAQGARRVDGQILDIKWGQPSLAALYETAIRREFGYGALTDGGQPADGMAMITGAAKSIEAPTGSSGLRSDQVDELAQILSRGGQVTVSSPRSVEPELNVVDSSGAERKVRIVARHSYCATRIEQDGSIWVRNPWGPANSYDGGGEFRVSAEDVSRYFWRATHSNVGGAGR